jgi:hypothetical protein
MLINHLKPVKLTSVQEHCKFSASWALGDGKSSKDWHASKSEERLPLKGNPPKTGVDLPAKDLTA